MALEIINPGDNGWAAHRYVLCFGAYGCTTVLVFANHLEDALDEAVNWIADHAPGLLADEAVAEAYKEAIAEGKEEEAAQEEAEVDTTRAGNNGHYLRSWEWGIVAEDPDRATLKSIVKDQTGVRVW